MNNKFKQLNESLKVRHEFLGLGYLPIVDDAADYVASEAEKIGYTILGKIQDVWNKIDSSARISKAEAEAQKKELYIKQGIHETKTKLAEWLIKYKYETLAVSAVISLAMIGFAIRSILKGIIEEAKSSCKRGRTGIAPNGKTYFQNCVNDEKKKIIKKLINELDKTKNKLLSLPKKYQEKAIKRINKYTNILKKKLKELL